MYGDHMNPMASVPSDMNGYSCPSLMPGSISISNDFSSFTNLKQICTYTHTYICTYVRTYIHTVHTYIPTYVHTLYYVSVSFLSRYSTVLHFRSTNSLIS